MGKTRDQTRAALLVLAVVLTAGMFAGFAFGATAHDIRRQSAPLLLQSSSVVRTDTPECDGAVTVRQANAARANRLKRGV